MIFISPASINRSVSVYVIDDSKPEWRMPALLLLLYCPEYNAFHFGHAKDENWFSAPPTAISLPFQQAATFRL
jgi:hypothetical protein